MLSRTRRSTFTDAEVVCHWCLQSAKDSPYRALIKDIPGGRYIVCGPLCPDRPADTLVLADWRQAK